MWLKSGTSVQCLHVSAFTDEVGNGDGRDRGIVTLGVYNIYRSEVFDLVLDLVEQFVHFQTFGVAVAAEAEDDDAGVFAEDGLVDVPA
jgi:hypothetical protein